jgi:hypothetical protein
VIARIADGGNQPNVNAKTSTPRPRNSISNWRGLRLSDQLIEALFGHYAVALFVNVNSVSGAWRLPVD